MSTDNLSNLESAVEAMLARASALTPELIRTWIAQLQAVPAFAVSDEDAEALARRLEVRHQVTMSVASVLHEKGFIPWLESRKVDIDFYYWDRYRRLLELKSIPKGVITTLHADTDKTLGYLGNPLREGPWQRRGMVMGHVQSGKTSNYAGLVCKAADAGYKLIIIIAGIHNNLRNQTQKRIDEGFVGRDSAILITRKEDYFVGVGKIDARRRPVTFTNSVRDFNKQIATGVNVPLQNLKEPAVFVVKKNANTLKNLLDWLRQHNAGRSGAVTINEPMLLIDDEADNASINVSYDKGEVTRINRDIRELLQLFSRSCYVGYTATPFANIFIDPDTDDLMLGEDLFPRDFIISLDPPSNYFGPGTVFGTSAKSVIRHIQDQEALPLSHKKDFAVTSLPASMEQAVRAFIIARAIRFVRGHRRQHMSMLINASRFTDVQGRIRSAVQNLVDAIQVAIRLNAALPADRALRDPEMKRLQQVWESEYADTGVSWAQVQAELNAAAAPVKVVEVNSRASGTLNYDDYPDGLAVIAVGGYSLSRGLTLEGLVVSYFLRNSMMYDTLMQMGRWFGYRPDYEDLCRVWMPEEAEGWYAHITDSIEELREELRTMAAAGATPKEFGLKVRAHPDTLIVTARNKMGAGERIVVEIGLGNHFVETWMLRREEDALADNRNATRNLSERLKESGIRRESIKESFLFSNVSVDVVRDFLMSFKGHPDALLTSVGPVVRYIDDRAASELSRWDVLFAGVGNPSAPDTETLGFTIGPQQRTIGRRSDDRTLLTSDKQRVASRGVEKAGLEPDEIARAEAQYRAMNNLPESASPNYPDRIYRAARTRPLLVVHLLNLVRKVEGETVPPLFEKPVVAWSISFPSTAMPEKRVQYVVTPIWLRENMRDESTDDDIDADAT